MGLAERSLAREMAVVLTALRFDQLLLLLQEARKHALSWIGVFSIERCLRLMQSSSEAEGVAVVRRLCAYVCVCRNRCSSLLSAWIG